MFNCVTITPAQGHSKQNTHVQTPEISPTLIDQSTPVGAKWTHTLDKRKTTIHKINSQQKQTETITTVKEWLMTPVHFNRSADDINCTYSAHDNTIARPQVQHGSRIFRFECFFFFRVMFF